jgi:hypothetical protein
MREVSRRPIWNDVGHADLIRESVDGIVGEDPLE